MKKGVVILLVLSFLISGVNAGVHSGDNVLIKVNNYNMPLKDAFNNHYLISNGPAASSSVSISTQDHNASNIYISVNGIGYTLQNATSLCGNGTQYNYTGNIIFGHKGNDIILPSGKNLQKAINDGDFCCTLQTCGQLGCGSHGPNQNTCWTTIGCSACCSGTYSCSGVCGTVNDDCGNPHSCSCVWVAYARNVHAWGGYNCPASCCSAGSDAWEGTSCGTYGSFGKQCLFCGDNCFNILQCLSA